MYAIGESLLYGGSGVMTVVDIREEMFGDVSHKYYVLRPASLRTESLTFVPTENKKLVSMMRPLLKKEEIYRVMRELESADDVAWNMDNRRRSDGFKEIIESGDRLKMLAMIRTIRRAGDKREKEGKKNYLSDEVAMRKAMKLITTEFATVLSAQEEQVEEAVISAMDNADCENENKKSLFR